MLDFQTKENIKNKKSSSRNNRREYNLEKMKERSSKKRDSASYKKHKNMNQNPKTIHNLYKSMRPDTFKIEKFKTTKLFTRDNFSSGNHNSVNVTPKYSTNFASEMDPRMSPSPYTSNSKKRKILFPTKNHSIDI